MKTLSTIQDKMIEGSLDALDVNPNGIVIGTGLAEKFNLGLGRNLTVMAANGASRAMKVVGLFRTGNASTDETQTFTLLKRAQVMFDRPKRVNRFLIQLDDAYAARTVAQRIEDATGDKSVSWVEASEDILIAASFGIYNTLSTIVLEKTRDIATLKSMGFHARDVRLIFLFEGVIIGLTGSLFGLALGAGLMHGLSRVQIKLPGVSDKVFLPIWWGAQQFVLATAFAMAPCILAAYLPARRAGRVHPGGDPAGGGVSAVLRAENLVRILPGEVPVTLVNDVSLAIERGELICIMGPSGSGKSSLLYLRGLLDVPTSGRVSLDGEDDLANRRLEKLGFVFQFHSLRCGRSTCGDRSVAQHNLRDDAADDRDQHEIRACLNPMITVGRGTQVAAVPVMHDVAFLAVVARQVPAAMKNMIRAGTSDASLILGAALWGLVWPRDAARRCSFRWPRPGLVRCWPALAWPVGGSAPGRRCAVSAHGDPAHTDARRFVRRPVLRG